MIWVAIERDVICSYTTQFDTLDEFLGFVFISLDREVNLGLDK